MLPAQLFAQALDMEIHGAAVSVELRLPDSLINGVPEEGDVPVPGEEQQQFIFLVGQGDRAAGLSKGFTR